MKIKAVVKKNQIIIPNFYNLKDGEIWLEVKFGFSQKRIFRILGKTS